ncbi:MAG: 3-hydroxyacyl-CoA dehydrogenase NAD-binding domain-containing protein, partial [Microvirga sp.]
FAAAADAALRGRRSRDAAREAVAAVRRAVTLPFAEALRAERAAFQCLRASEASAALRHLFFAERRAGRIDGAPAAREVRSVAVVGAGTMGAGIASTFLAHGFPVTLVETSGEALERGLDRIAEIESRAVKAGRIDAAESQRRRARLSASIDLVAAGPCDLVVEAVFEDMALKREVFGRLDGIVPPGAILASNTSYLDLDAIASAASRPERVVGLHFFSPAHVMRLVEVVRGARTSPETLATVLQTARRLNKVPVIARVCEGFIGNRIFTAYRAQCERMLEDGAFPEEIDRALAAFGFAMGPFAAWDLAGLDIAWHTRRRLAASGDAKQHAVSLLDQLCAAGRFGRKAGLGWYRYPEGTRAGVPDPEVHALIRAHSLREGIARRPVRDEEIVGRALAAIVNEAALVLHEGIAERAGDVDLVLVDGYGFPADRGGPLFWARRRRTEIVADLERLARSTGPGFRRGPVESILWPTG